MTSGNISLPGARFPAGFVFGSATASYQIEGAATEDGRGPSIWDTFSHTPGRTYNGDTGDVACDHYHRLESDLDLMASYGLAGYRFSLAWPRIQPGGSGAINQPGIDFYDRLIDGLLARGIKPTATLYHWDLPQPLEDAGGWPHRDTAERFGEYAAICGRAFGDRVDTWITLNEPWCSAALGYGSGQHAPGRSNPLDVVLAAHTLALAHGHAVRALRETAPSGRVATTLNLYQYYAATDSAEDLAALARADATQNLLYTDPVLLGGYSDAVVDAFAGVSDFSFVADGDAEIMRQPIDALGLNYYSTSLVRAGTNAGPRPPSATVGCDGVEFVTEAGPYTDMGWNIKPQGLYDKLMHLSKSFPGLELIVTENGAAYDDPIEDGRIHDRRRIDYLVGHLGAVHAAIEDGAPVSGYYVWSLMDNFEWGYGYSKRFGITHIDYETLERTPRDSALWFTQLARTGVLPAADAVDGSAE